MRKDRMMQARELWEAGRYLHAGQLLHDDLARERRPAWAAAILAAVYPYVPQTTAIDAVLEVAHTPTRWHEGHTVFVAVRTLTLRVDRQDRLYEAILILAENTAKVVFNATQPTAPFDADSGWWVVPNLMSVCALVDDPQLTARAWTLISTSASGSSA